MGCKMGKLLYRMGLLFWLLNFIFVGCDKKKGASSSNPRSSTRARIVVTSTPTSTATTSTGVITRSTPNFTIVSESGTVATFSLYLSEAPTSDVTITITSSDTSEGSVSPSSLTFTSSNYSTAQKITVTGVNDELSDGDITFNLSFSVTSADSYYNQYSLSSLNFTNLDNETDIKFKAYIKSDFPEASDDFTHVALWNDTLVIGASSEDSAQTVVSNTIPNDNGKEASGAVMVYKRTAGVWALDAYIKAPNAEFGDYFGGGVEIYDNTIAVGAIRESGAFSTITNGDGSNFPLNSAGTGSISSAGAVYIFKKSSSLWAPEAYIKPLNPSANDFFGWNAIALYQDTLAVGVPNEDGGQTSITNGNNPPSVDGNSLSDSGAVYVFRRTGTIWTQEAYIKPSFPDANDNFGWSVSIHEDTLVIGAYSEDSNQSTISHSSEMGSSNNTLTDSGAAYVYKRTGSNWQPEAFIKASNASSNSNFGSSVAVSGDTIVISAHAEDGNGSTVVNSATAPSASGSTNSGAAYIYKRSNGIWQQEAYIKAPNRVSGDAFGRNVNLDGNQLVVCANQNSSSSTIINDDPTTLPTDTGSTDSGSCYIYNKKTSGEWTFSAYLVSPNPSASDFLGSRGTAISRETIAVSSFEGSNIGGIQQNTSTITSNESASTSGAVYIFQRE